MVYVKALQRSVVSMAYIPTSKATAPLRTSWFLPRIKTPWKTKVGPSTDSIAGTLHAMRNAQGRPLGPLEKDPKNT